MPIKTNTRKIMATLVATVFLTAASAAQAQQTAKKSTVPAPRTPVAAGAVLQKYNFEAGVDGWVATAKTVSLGTAGNPKKSGKASLKISGTSTSDVYNFALSPRTDLHPGKQYQATAWLYVKDWDNATKPPMLKIALYKDGKWVSNTFSNTYAFNKKSQWQKLTVTVTAPTGGAIAGSLSVEKGMQDQVKATMYLDEIKLQAMK